MKSLFKLIVTVLFIVIIISCNGCVKNQNTNTSLVNLSHLDHLFEEIEIDNKSMAIIHIYADYPDYKWIDAPGEGTACIDDVTRAAIVFLRHYKYTGEQSSLAKAKKLLDFVLYMQAPNGMFYNFIFSDLTINKTRSNSVPKTDWWAWRAIWAMSEAISVFEKTDNNYSDKLRMGVQKTFPLIDSLLQNYPNKEISKKILYPGWLPNGTAADQASVLMLGLDAYYKSIQDTAVKRRLEWIGQGIIAMQKGDSLNAPYNAFLSWQNKWHAYGNSQASALLQAGGTVDNKNFISSGIAEVKYFYPYLKNKNHLNQFSVEFINNQFELTDISQFAQIAYGIRPMVLACLKAYEHTKNENFARQAGEIASWLLGQNISGLPMYDPQTGRCFDGIEDSEKINKNSGAESTIEALLTLIEIENNPIARKVLDKYYNNDLKNISN